MRTAVEQEMIALAKTLPVNRYFNPHGWSAKGLAVVVGEVGNLSDYKTVKGKQGDAKLYKRLGLAVMPDGYRQGYVPPHITGAARKQAWIERGYNGQRRGQVWPFIDDNLVKSQWRKDGTALGKYGAMYGRRKPIELAKHVGDPRQLIKADMAARHYMCKKFIHDLWYAWRAAERHAVG